MDISQTVKIKSSYLVIHKIEDSYLNINLVSSKELQQNFLISSLTKVLAPLGICFQKGCSSG